MNFLLYKLLQMVSKQPGKGDNNFINEYKYDKNINIIK